MKPLSRAAVAAVVLALMGVGAVHAVTPAFGELHREPVLPEKQVVLKKLLFAAGLMNAVYLGINDLVAALQLAKKATDAKGLSAQLFAVMVGLQEKPAMLRHIAGEIRFCEAWPNFPVGFPDSPEGCDPISREFEIMADHIEKLGIQYQSTSLATLKKEADRVVFALFWTDSEKIRTLCHSILTFIRMELKEDLPFEVFAKPRP
ncbi:MAG: hypothetical protein GX442_17100 [Candidatus Riflebacteria bacterium]|nr:hypothetical protein [Candidatus Riflebacteria bacterium]